jgi:probable RNA-binding protein EIF1AD
LHEIETPNGEKYLVSMPTKFRKNVWIKRGDFVLIQPIEEGEKVKGEIINILYGEQIKYIQSQGKWYVNNSTLLYILTPICIKIHKYIYIFKFWY